MQPIDIPVDLTIVFLEIILKEKKKSTQENISIKQGIYMIFDLATQYVSSELVEIPCMKDM